jgi:hypothetical protein
MKPGEPLALVSKMTDAPDLRCRSCVSKITACQHVKCLQLNFPLANNQRIKVRDGISREAMDKWKIKRMKADRTQLALSGGSSRQIPPHTDNTVRTRLPRSYNTSDIIMPVEKEIAYLESCF